jgi:hypothetical protein
MKIIRFRKALLMLGIVLTWMISGKVYAQSDKGMTFTFGIMGAKPVNSEFNATHTWGAGPISSLVIPLHFKGDLVLTLKANSFLGKPLPGKTGYYKHKNILFLMAGYRYNFNPDIESAFYIEPRIGYTWIGTKNSAICYEPTFGYYFNDKYDINIWFQNAVTDFDYERIGAVGVTVNLSFHNLLKFLNYY